MRSYHSSSSLKYAVQTQCAYANKYVYGRRGSHSGPTKISSAQLVNFGRPNSFGTRVASRQNMAVTCKADDTSGTVASSAESFAEALKSMDEGRLEELKSGDEGIEEERDVDVIPLTAQELRTISEEKWGVAYDMRINQRRNQLNQLRLYFQVMWKFLGQKSFPMSEKRYMEQLGAVAELLNEWGVADQVRQGLLSTNKRPVVDTTGGNSVNIALEFDEE